MPAEHSQPEPERIGSVTLDEREFDVYADQTQLPGEPAKRAICEAHIAAGRAGELYDEFLMTGCDFPGEGEDPAINIKFACKGLSTFRRHCRLTLTQYDTDGKILNNGEFAS